MSYETRLREAGTLAVDADRLLREFAASSEIPVGESDSSLTLRATKDRRSVVFQPQPQGSKLPGLRIQFHHVDDEEAGPVRRGIVAVGGKDAPIFALVPLRRLVERWEDVRSLVLDPFFQIQERQPLSEGARVRLGHAVERYPLVLEAGLTGTVVLRDKGVVAVKLDERVEGLSDWDNELMWNSEDEARADLREVDSADQWFGVEPGWFILVTGPGHKPGARRRYRIDDVQTDRVVLREMYVDWQDGAIWKESVEGSKEAFALEDMDVISHDPPQAGAPAAADPRAPSPPRA